MKGTQLKASLREADMPSSLRLHLNMASPFPLPRRLFLFASLFLFHLGNSLPAVAQDTGPATPTGPVAPGAVVPGSSTFQNAPVNNILDLYEQLSGKHLIRDAMLSGVPPMNLNMTGLSKVETIKMIEQFLLLNGVAFIPVDDHNLKVVSVPPQGKNPRSEGVKIFANAADLPTTDEVISYYMPLSYISPIEAKGIFDQVAPAHQYGVYVPAPSAQAIVLTENVSVIRQLIALKELIDAPPARVVSEWVQLNRADAQAVSDILNKMLGIGPTGAPAAPAGAAAAVPGGAAIVPASLGNDAPISNEHNLISGTAQILPDLRSNRVLVITRPVNMPFLEQMIAQLDQADIFMVPQRRPLKYVLAQNILPALEAALAEGTVETTQVQKDQQAAQAAQTKATGTAGATGAPASTAGASSGGTGSVAAITPQLVTPTENDVPTVITIGKTKLLADNRSNSIIVFGSPDVVARVFDMIDQLDRKPLQVYLATVIGQLTVKEGEEFGIDILQKFQHVGQGGLASSNLNSSQAGSATGSSFLPEPSSLTSALGFPLPTGLTLYGAIGSTLNAYVRALENTDRFKIISRPSVYTTNNKLAVIASGSQVPVPSSTTSGFTGTSSQLETTSSIAYEDVLLQLDIIPLINANHEVSLQIRQTNNSLGNNINISGNLVPIINTQEINTTITVPDKSTVVIGGLINDSTTRDTSGVPWLSDIPILGYLFKDTTKSKQRDELIIMIQPTVVETDADQIAVNEAEKQRTILGREAVETATGVTGPLPQPALAPRADVQSTTIRSSTYNSKTGAPTQTTTTTTLTVKRIPTSETPTGPTSGTSPVPALSSPAPDVSNGQMPPYSPAPNPPPAASP
jgi:general secretion pathway protein D